MVETDGQEILWSNHFQYSGSIIHHDGEIEEDVVYESNWDVKVEIQSRIHVASPKELGWRLLV